MNTGSFNPQRYSDDIILTNVLGFDVKIWDPGAPMIVPANQTMAAGPGEVLSGGPNSATGLQVVQPFPQNQNPVAYGTFADLGWNPNYTATGMAPVPWFNGRGLVGNALYMTYDTWSTDYHVVSGNTLDGADGFDNNSDGVVDDVNEQKPSAAPYPYPARGIQVKIRAFDPASRQIREMTIVHDFLPR
jgi:hypothetical protein